VKLFDRPNLLAQAVYTAFYKHYPLKLAPDVVWLTIVQGVGSYVDKHHEALRGKFVSHQDQKTLTVVRPDFQYGSPTNDWESVFPQFATLIDENTTQGTRELLECSFSTTTPVDRACSHIALMDVCKHYFKYVMLCGCGIPYIELMGTVEDWRLMEAKVRELGRFKLEGDPDKYGEWVECLGDIAGQFVAAAEGHPDTAFCGSGCNLCGASGGAGSPVTGWVSGLFLYRGSGEPNWYAVGWREAYELAKKEGAAGALAKAVKAGHGGWFGEGGTIYGMDLDSFPLGINRAPVKVLWLGVGKEEELSFCGGLAAIHQHKDGALEVRTGWAVVGEKPAAQNVPNWSCVSGGLWD
jgi:hypothetical protein